MTANPQPPRTWAPLLKPGRPVETAARVTLWSNGALDIPSAAHDALGAFERVHLFVAEDRPGQLWLVPAEDDDETAYRISRSQRGYGRRLTAAELPGRLRVDPDRDVVRGDWKIQDFDQLVVQFDVPEGEP